MLEMTLHPQGLAVQDLENGGRMMSFQSPAGIVVNIPLGADGVKQLQALLSGANIQIAGGNQLHLAKK